MHSGMSRSPSPIGSVGRRNGAETGAQDPVEVDPSGSQPYSRSAEERRDSEGKHPRPSLLPSFNSNRELPSMESPNSLHNPYASLQYAPRQKSAGLSAKPSQSTLQAHSSLWRQQRGTTDTHSPSLINAIPDATASASSPMLTTSSIEGVSVTSESEPVDGTSRNIDQLSAAQALAKQQLRADAEQLGVRVGSVGWALLEKIQCAPSKEWRELDELLSRGEACLVLPTSPLRSKEVTLSHAYNHILFSTVQDPSRPLLFKSSIKGKEKESASLVTFKGLRACIVDDTFKEDLRLEFKSFVPRENMSFVSQLKDAEKRSELCKTFSPLPSHSLSPHFKILAYTPSLLLPPSLARKQEAEQDTPHHGSRTTSNGSLLSPDQPRGNRASGTFATLFGGRRDRRGQAADEGKELKDLTDLAAKDSNINNSRSLIGPSLQVAQPTRSIAVLVIDEEVRRSHVLFEVAVSMQERIRVRLGSSPDRPALPESIVEVVCSFAAIFVPPFGQAQGGRSVSRSASTDTNLAKSPGNAPLSAPFLSSPDELADSFQDFYNSIKAQLDEARGTNTSDEDIERVEEAVCEEIYDRIFCPSTSLDIFHDEALLQRIIALDHMGISLRHLGLLLPNEGTAEEAIIKGGLQELVARCGTFLNTLSGSKCVSPVKKLAALVAAHKAIVEGLAKLPEIRMIDDAEAKVGPTQAESLPSLAAGQVYPSSSPSGADLILPILIYSIICSNPPQLISNLLYIQRFHSETLLRGEASYCLVNVQAAVAFLENVEPVSLGLVSDSPLVTAKDLEQVSRLRDPGSLSLDSFEGSSNINNNTVSMPVRMRSRVAHDVGELAGMSNRVITGVLGSSLTAFGRMMGAGTNYAMGIDSGSASLRGLSQDDRQQKRSIDDVRSLLSGSAAAVKLGSVLNKVVAVENEGKSTVPLPFQPRPRAVQRTTSASSRAPTDYGREGDMMPEAKSSGGKASISDRLASLPLLNRSGTASPQALLTAIPPGGEDGASGPSSYHGEVKAKGETQSGQAEVSPGDVSLLLSPAVIAPQPLKQRDVRIPASLQSPYPALSCPPSEARPLHVVLACSGSVASIKIPLIVERLLQFDHVNIQVVSTKASRRFFNTKELVQKAAASGEGDAYTVHSLARENASAGDLRAKKGQSPRLHVWTDEDEWEQWDEVGDPILHIELRRWADIVLVAPCSANTLAKINAGICDDLLTCFLRALSPTTPTYLFPAMNTLMYMHPLTARHLAFAQQQLGYHIVGPIEKRLACGDLGQGAMQEWSDIVKLVVQRYSLESGSSSSQEDAAMGS